MNLMAAATSSTQIALNWTPSTDNVGVTAYYVERCSGASCSSFVQIATTGGATTYSDSSVVPSTSYSYRIRATDAAGNLSAYSNTALATTSAAAAIVVTVSPSTANVQAGIGTQAFAATLTNDTQSKGVTWSVSGAGCAGTACGTLSNVTNTSVTYNAPSNQPSPATVTVTATSVADPTRSTSASVTVLAAVSVSVSPPTASVQQSQSQGFTASVSNDPGSLGVTWSLAGSGCSGAACGTLSNVTTASVTYTAPATLPSPATVTLTATSKSDGTKTNASTITLATAAAIVVTVSPPTAGVGTRATRNFTVTVQNDSQNKGVGWSVSGSGCSGSACGTLSNVTTSSVTYNAPVTVPNPATATLTATSVADGTKSGTATITMIAVSTNIAVSVSPKRGGLVTSQTLAITATLTNDTGNAGVTWSTTGGSFPTLNSTSATFMAPATPGVVTITAASVADPSKTATATIGVTNLTGVTTYLNSNNRQGANTQEYALATSGVTAVDSANFGKLFSCTVDGPIYAQPLWVAGVSIAGKTHNLVLVATQHDSVYAFDADANPCMPLWQASLIDTAHGAASSSETWVTSNDNDCTDIYPDIGIVGTPVIDPNTQTLYVVSKSKNASSTNFYQRIHALDLAIGNEKFSGPTTISASVSGTGSGSSGDSVSFDPLLNNQRSALLLSNGHVIIAWASHCDTGAYHGWVMSYNASSLAREAVLNLSPNGINSGVWMSGNGPASDSGGNIYFATGNGTFDANGDYGDAIMKLGPPSGGSFPVLSYFRSYTLLSPDNADIDQGSGGLLLLPAVGSHNYLVQAGKDGIVYLADQSSLGGYSSSSNNVVESFRLSAIGSGVWGSPTYWNGSVYFGASQDPSGPTDPARAFSFDTSSTAMLSTSPTSVTTGLFGYPGPTLSISANGTSNGIAWALENLGFCTDQSTRCGPAILHAYDASNLATEFWNSSQNPADTAGNAVKFTVPTVVNGKVYVGTRGNDTGSGGASIPGELDVYGLKPN
jgi:hypothetical protein